MFTLAMVSSVLAFAAVGRRFCDSHLLKTAGTETDDNMKLPALLRRISSYRQLFYSRR